MDDLASLDAALVRLRRLWSPARTRAVDDAGTPVEMSSLLVVEACARSGGAATVTGVAAFADVAHSTAVRLVDRAQAAGLVRRGPAAPGTRGTAVRLTAAGAALRDRAYAARTAWLAGLLDGWPDADVTTLARLLTRLAAAVEHADPPAPPPAARPGPAPERGSGSVPGQP